MKIIVCTSKQAQDLGLFLLRVGIGLIFMTHGWGKLMGGPQTWQWLGSNMSLFGINFFFAFWGLVAACSEFCGGVLLLVGLYTRVAAFFMACVMIMALAMHWNKGDAFQIFSHPLSLLVVFIALIIAGSGSYSLDQLICSQITR